MTTHGSAPTAHGTSPDPDPTRREFIASACAVSAAPAALGAAATPADRSQLPQMTFGRYRISRLVCGANCFNAGSHLSIFVNEEMRRYYTTEQKLRTLRRCEEVGVNCFQSAGRDWELYRMFIDSGGRMYYVSLGENFYRDPVPIETLAKAGCIAIAHHGEATDQLFKEDRFERVGDYVKQVKDAGLMAGVSTHMPAVVDAVESKGWDVDFYMTCVYERHRTPAELAALLGQAVIPDREVYLVNDPPRMFRAMRQTKRPCLAFKILAAGRLSERKEWVERAFRQTFESIKPDDGVIVGIYDKFADQPAENAEYVRRFAPLSRPA